MNKTLELFYLFLEANGALIAWEQNFLDDQAKQDKPISRAEWFHLHIAAGNRWIIRAFCWTNTPQDHVYWDNLHQKWNIHLNQNI